MKVDHGATAYSVQRERGEPRCTSESDFWFRLRNHLRAQGHDVVKKRPDKDGHMTSAPYYLRDRKGAFAIADGQYALRLVHLDFNSYTPVYLDYHLWHMSSER